MKEYQIVKPVSYLQKCFQLILVQFVTLEAIYILYRIEWINGSRPTYVHLRKRVSHPGHLVILGWSKEWGDPYKWNKLADLSKNSLADGVNPFTPSVPRWELLTKKFNLNLKRD